MKRENNMDNLNTIICADNLQVLKQMRGTVDLVYLDPPYATESKLVDSDDNMNALHLLNKMLRPRIILIRGLLADRGSLYFHCDWRTSAYIQVLLDELFGAQNLIAKIIWQRNPVASSFQRFISNTYDVIFFYGKSKHVKYFPQYTPYSKSEIATRYKYQEEETGKRYRLVNITTSNAEPPRYTYEFLGVTRNWRFSKEKMEEEFKQGRIVQSQPGAVPMRKHYMNEGKLIGDVWTDINKMTTDRRESTGYSAQRPLPLLQRILAMSTEKGDVVLDPFCGSGTTLVAAEMLERKWIGIDISPTACEIATERISLQRQDTNAGDFLRLQDKRAFKELSNLPAYEFESWVISTLKKVLKENRAFAKSKGLEKQDGAEVYSITSGSQLDFGFDFSSRLVPVMVKQKDKVEGKEIEKFAIQLNHHKQNEGIYVALSFLKSAQAEAVKKQKEGLRIILISAKELLRK
jgi:DNA modification methylase